MVSTRPGKGDMYKESQHFSGAGASLHEGDNDEWESATVLVAEQVRTSGNGVSKFLASLSARTGTLCG